MIPSWLHKKKQRVDPEQLSARADEVLQQIQNQQPRVNVITSFLNRRTLENGFGTDFEYTLRPKES